MTCVTGPDGSLAAGLGGDHPDSVCRERRAPTTGVPRVVRVAVLGGTSLVLACAAHMVGGGQLPSAGVLIVAGILIGLVAVTSTTRRCRTGALLGLLAVQQFILHLVFEASAAAGCGVMSEVAGHHAAMSAHAAPACMMTSAADTMSMPGWAMWVGHLVATLLTALLLARGEAWLWRVADQVITAATAAPSHRQARQRRPPVAVEPFSPATPRAYTPADPRGPPQLIVVS